MLNGVYFVNAASLFMYSAIVTQIQLNNNNNKELTTVSMSPSTVLIEGTETVIMYTLFIVLHQYILYLYSIFAICVTITILQRLYTAYYKLDTVKTKA